MIAHKLDVNKWRSEDVSLTTEECASFTQLHLKENVLQGLSQSGFTRPSPIQLQAIPLGRCGLDLIAQSKSGTGKTCVFVVVALEMLCHDSCVTQVLILAPTREIAVQISQVVDALSRGFTPAVKCVCVIGGTKVKEDKEHMDKSGAGQCQIIVGTPGRVKQLIELKVLKTNSIRLLVLDEADKLMDNNFKVQIDEIYSSLPQNKQMIATSATMSNQLVQFLSRYMRTPAFVRLNADNPALVGVTQFYQLTSPHHLDHVNFDNKIESLIDIMKKISFSQCLVFSNYQTRARILCDKLNANNWPSSYISAEKNQQERLKTMIKLQKFKCRVLVSTDLTARGIDVQNINLVINMDVPWDLETYLHRIGRAGRFGSQGIAVTLVSRGREYDQLEKLMKEGKLSIRQMPHPIPHDIWKLTKSMHFDMNLDMEKEESEDETKKENAYGHDIEDKKFLDKESANEKLNSSHKTLIPLKEITKQYQALKNELVNKSMSEIKFSWNKTDEELGELEDEDFTSSPLISNSSDETACFMHESISRDKMTSDKPVNKKDVCFKLEENYDQYMNDMEDYDKYFEYETNHVFMSNMNVSSSSSLSSAFFPPIHAINSTLQYSQWIKDNKNIWISLLNGGKD